MKKIYISAVLMGLAMTACSNHDDVLVNEDNGIETISAEIIQPAGMDSRIIVGNLWNGVYPMKWRAEDPNTKPKEADGIYVYDSKGASAYFVYSEEQDAAVGIFKNDNGVIEDVKEALCIPGAVTGKKAPATIDGQFSYMSTMMYHGGAENVPMYGKMVDGVLQFKALTGMLRIDIPNLTKEFRTDAANKLGVKVAAYSEYTDETTNVKKFISATKAHVDFSDVANPKLVLDSGQKEFIGIFLQAGTTLENKVYCPLLVGDYARIEITIYPDTNFKNAPLSETVVLTPKEGKKTFTIENKVYSVKKEFVKIKK